MLENMKNTLFNINADAVVIDFNNTHYNEDVDVEVPINIVMEKSLTRVTQFLNAIVSLNIASLKCLAKKWQRRHIFVLCTQRYIYIILALEHVFNLDHYLMANVY